MIKKIFTLILFLSVLAVGQQQVKVVGGVTLNGTSAVTIVGGINVVGTSAVSIQGTPTVTFSGTSAVSIVGGVTLNGTVATSNVGGVTLNGTSAVSIQGTPTVSMSGTAAVSIQGTPNVSFSGTAAVSVQGTPSITWSGTPSVSIPGTPTVNNRTNQSDTVIIKGTRIPPIASDTITFSLPWYQTPTPYSIGDVISNATAVGTTVASCALQAFNGAARYTGGGGIIVGARLVCDTNYLASPTLRLYLYSDSVGVTKFADNAPFNMSFTTASTKRVGWIDFTMQSVVSTAPASFDYKTPLTMPYRCVNQSLYGRLVATSAFTPKIYGQFFIQLFYMRD